MYIKKSGPWNVFIHDRTYSPSQENLKLSYLFPIQLLPSQTLEMSTAQLKGHPAPLWCDENSAPEGSGHSSQPFVSGA